ncbi:MAG: hypothetical protein DMF81_25330 [Acidobacteria bacterium]|nr:MAG: hypothetical protein DMF81_25330 [Acidobacteriota bacterium]
MSVLSQPAAGRGPWRTALARLLTSRITAILATLAIFAVLLRRIRLEPLLAALAQADYPRFLAVMVPNTVFYFCWDTLVLAVVIRWFHAPARYRDLLPVRAASYVVAFFNANAGRGALAAYLSRRLGSPFLQLGSTVLFLVLTEYMHLVAWATIGILAIRSAVPRELLWVPPGVALVWLAVFTYTRAGRAHENARWLGAPREWALLRTFRLAPARRYFEVVLLRAPMFFVSLCLHYLAAHAFGLQIPFWPMLAFLPVIFMLAALPITVAHLGTTQAAWIFFFGRYAPEPRLLAFSLAAHLTFVVTRSVLGLAFLPAAYADLVRPRQGRVAC